MLFPTLESNITLRILKCEPISVLLPVLQLEFDNLYEGPERKIIAFDLEWFSDRRQPLY